MTSDAIERRVHIDAPPEVVFEVISNPEQIAWMVCHLASPAGDYTTGSVITIDGARDNHIGPWPPERELGPDGKPAQEVRRRRSE